MKDEELLETIGALVCLGCPMHDRKSENEAAEEFRERLCGLYDCGKALDALKERLGGQDETFL